MLTVALIGAAAFATVGMGFAIAGSHKFMEEVESDGENSKRHQRVKSPHPLLDAFNNIAYGNELDQFKLIERNAKTSKFQYLYGGYLFTVSAKEYMVGCKVEKENFVLIDYAFDQGWDEYDKKTIARTVLELGEYEEILNLIEDFMDEVNHYGWFDSDDSLIIIDDSKGDIVLTDGYETPDEPAQIFPKGISDMKVFVLSHEVEGEVQAKFLNAIEKVEEAGRKLAALDMKLDIESRHIYEELIEKDITKLFTAFVNLNEEKQGVYQEKLIEGVDRINAKTTFLLEQIEKRNIHEIESVLHVIGERYEK